MEIFIDAGDFPCTIQCDFDPQFIGGKAAQLLRSHGTRVRAAPPRCQDKNGLVENKWQNLTKVARSFLADAHLPKKFWYWALREANLRSNIFPVSQKADDVTDPNFLTTPYYEFFEKKGLSYSFPFWFHRCFLSCSR